MRSRSSYSLLSILTLSAGVAAGLGCAGVKPNQSSTGGNGGNNSGSGGNGGNNSGGGGGGGNLPVTPISGSHTCTDFDTSSNCGSFNSGDQGKLDGSNTSGSTSIAYPLDNSLFPSNLGPIQVHLSSSGSSARIHFLTTQSSNVDVQYYGGCESAPGSGCVVTLPVAFTRMLIPACQTENIQLTARVLSGGTPTDDSSPVNVAWASTAVTGGLYYWTVLPNQNYCTGGSASNPVANPPNYCLLDLSQNPKNGTAIYRYDFSQDNPAPQQVWTDDGGPNSNPAYQGAPQAFNGGTAGGHCIGCHSITNDGKFMGLTIGGSSTANAANWEILDIQKQDLFSINPTRTGGNGCSDPNATPTSDQVCYWEQYRKDQFATEMTWGPGDDVMVSMYKSKLYFNSVSATQGSATATISQTGPALPNSAGKIDPYQSDPFWSHDGQYLVYTSFSQAATPDATGNPSGLNGDLKTGGRIAIASATTESINDDAHVLVDRQNGITSYYPVISEDSNWVVYNQSNCGGNSSATESYNGSAGYGAGVCDGYDDSSAKLYLVSTDGNTMLNLDKANGSGNNDNSWPRFSPDVSTFRGQTLYWVAFSSRRPYGTELNTNGISNSQPQLWFAALTLGEINDGDPSWAPVWLPGQNPDQTNPYGNHVPQWVRVAIVIDQP
jgi:WD40-like Beta Propeller Repeat